MTFDPRSLEYLRELGRQLPQKLPEPSANARTTVGGHVDLCLWGRS